MPKRAAAFSSTRRPSGTTSLPMPSPGITAIRCVVIEVLLVLNYRIRPHPLVGSRAPRVRPMLGSRRCHEESSMSERRYWIGVASNDHVVNAVNEGFVQLSHGKAGPVERLHPGDAFVWYSPRTAYPAGPPLQAFTAI